jgi:MtN3 and saliva related transmembrane protein
VVNLLGFIAAAFTALSFLPQVLKAARTRSTGDLSTPMLASQATGVGLWVIYGVAMRAAPIILSNTVTLMLCLTLLTMKARESARRP